MSESGSRYLVVEGPIGVGKTSLAMRLAKTFARNSCWSAPRRIRSWNVSTGTPRSAALPTQLSFLFQRARQLQQLRQGDIFQPTRVADFLLEKDRLFAQLNLDDEELKLYEQVYQHLTLDAPRPDLVIYLQAPVDVLSRRIIARGIGYERLIQQEYLEKVTDAYARFFHHYSSSPLLIVNATDINPLENEEDYALLVREIRRVNSGRHYFNPTPASVR